MHVVNVQTRQVGTFKPPSGNGQIAVSDQGALAWLDYVNGTDQLLLGMQIRSANGALAGVPEQIDQGQIAANSLSFTGLTLHWTKNGAAQSRSLQPIPG